MPAFETMDRYQKALLWSRVGYDQHSQPVVATGLPVELNVRWQDSKRQSLDAQGNTIAVDATAVLDRVILNGSIMWLGALNDLPGTAYTPETDLMEVSYCKKVPDLKNRFQRYEVGLIRYKNSLPSKI